MRKGKTEKIDIASKLLFSIAVFLGVAVMMLSLVGIGVVIAIPAAAGACTIIALQLADDKKKYILAAAFIYVCVAMIFLKTGLAVTLNELIDSWQHIHPRTYVNFDVSRGNELFCQIVFLTSLTIPTAALIDSAVRRGSKPALTVTAGISAVVIIIFEQILPWYLILAAAISLVIWLFQIIGRDNTEYETMLAGDRAILIRVIPIVLVTAVIAGFAFKGEGYVKPSSFNTAEDLIHQTVSDMRYGGEKGAGMPEGRLYTAEALKLSDKPVLKVTIQNPQAYYLRGFVGGAYDESRWQSISEEKLYEHTDMFYWLHKNGFYGYTQLSEAASLSDDKAKVSELKVENVGASRKYIYAPYETTSMTEGLDVKSSEDSTIMAKGIRGRNEYTLMVQDNQVTRFPYIAAGLAQSEADGSGEKYIRNESYYNQFVYSSYMDVPEDIRMILSEYLGAYDVSPGEIHFDYQDAKQNITYFLMNKVNYEENIAKTGKDRDFITAFLSETKKGYSIHYASAAVMMFRYYGIPARYVEGYLITEDDAVKADNGDTIVLDGTHAHAWVEYYHDGVGWLPFEVTPSYMDVMPTAEEFKDISGLVGQNSRQQDMDIEEELQEEQTDAGIDKYWLQNSLIKAILICGLILLILIIALLIWIRHGLKKRDMMLAGFEDEDIAAGICNMFQYTTKLLLVWGLKAEQGSLMKQEQEFMRLMGDKTGEAYENAVELYQQAKYSRHEMTEEDREKMRSFKDKVYNEMWSRADTMERLQYKYMYFL